MMKTTVAAICITLAPFAAMAESHEATEADAAEEMAMDVGEITGDADKGERVFRKCKACHEIGDDAKNKAGPILTGVVGRVVGSVADFESTYSDALKEMGAEEKIWDVAALDAFLTKPREYVEGTKMNFAGLRKEDDRADVIAYLATFAASE